MHHASCRRLFLCTPDTLVHRLIDLSPSVARACHRSSTQSRLLSASAAAQCTAGTIRPSGYFSEQRLSMATTVPTMNGGPKDRVLTIKNMNENVIRMEYAVRGPIVIRAVELEKEVAQGAKKPFDNVIKANIGDCHAMGQIPITFIRQVLALCMYPQLMKSVDFPDDLKKKAQRILDGCGGKSLGSYSPSAGIEVVRQDVANYITKRDGGIQAAADNIYLTNGASEGIRAVLKCFINQDSTKQTVGVMIPIPQYPLYSATIAEFGLHQVDYYLDEANKWALDLDEMKRSYNEAKKVCDPKVLVVLNPGNPTGSVLSKSNIEEVVKFAYEHKLFLMADEVYQDNIYDPSCRFHSFKSILSTMGEPYSNMELASFHSVSKGYMGECGMRGGYAEIINMDSEVLAMFRKMTTAKLCSVVSGQALMGCITNPPSPGEESYELFAKEKSAVLSSLKERALLVEKTFNSIDGIRCNPVQGAMYAFPQLFLPPRAIEAAKKANVHPDFFYCMQLLEKAGICVVPGSGFGEREGTFHFRTTILPQPDKLKSMLERFRKFHESFMQEYK